MRDEWNNSKKVKIKYLSCEFSKILKHIHTHNIYYAYISIRCLCILFHRSLIRNSFESAFFLASFSFLNFSISIKRERIFNMKLREAYSICFFLNFHSYLSATPVIICAQALLLWCLVMWNFYSVSLYADANVCLSVVSLWLTAYILWKKSVWFFHLNVGYIMSANVFTDW